MADFLFRGTLAELDPAVFELTQLEAERQSRKLILIPSESAAPLAVREAMGSTFQNIYAEGYPDEETRWMKEAKSWIMPSAWPITGAMPIRAITRASNMPTWSKPWPAAAARKHSPPTAIPADGFL